MRIVMKQLCECGCGREIIKEGNRFIRGHNGGMKGKSHSLKTREKQSKRKTGKSNPMYGKKRPDITGENSPSKRSEVAKKISESLKALGENHPCKRPEFIAKRIGKSNPFFGKTHTEEFREGISKRMMGEENPMKNPEVAKKHSERMMGVCGPDHPNWQGGISCEPYCDIWLDKEFKESIKKRDGYTCQNPDCWEKCNHLPLHIHHIDYVKKNCAPQNLVTVCVSCNSRANGNREYWTNRYQEIMKIKGV